MQDAINRLRALEEQGMLTGFLDDRGKYVYVTREVLLLDPLMMMLALAFVPMTSDVQEMEGVAKWIRQRGRVSIAELAESSNTLIKLSE
jgi:hypothetical protein